MSTIAADTDVCVCLSVRPSAYRADRRSKWSALADLLVGLLSNPSIDYFPPKATRIRGVLDRFVSELRSATV